MPHLGTPVPKPGVTNDRDLPTLKRGGILFYPLGSGVCGAARSALEPMPTSAQMCSTGKAWSALWSKAESLGTPGCVSRWDLCLRREGWCSPKSWDGSSCRLSLPSRSCAGGIWDILLLQALNLLNY